MIDLQPIEIASMAELVDALDSKSGYRKVVQVRFLFGALFKIKTVDSSSFQRFLILKGMAQGMDL